MVTIRLRKDQAAALCLLAGNRIAQLNNDEVEVLGQSRGELDDIDKAMLRDIRLSRASLRNALVKLEEAKA